MKKNAFIATMAVVLVVLLSACSAIAPVASEQPAASSLPTASQSPVETQTTANDTGVIKIGALLPITGTWSDSGIAAEKALETGLPYVNDYLKNHGVQIELDIRDTKSDPAAALSELESMHEAGINTIIGPMSSDESENVLQYADENSVLLLSPSATSAELSKKDNFFRMVATDSSQVDGLTRIIKDVYQMKHLVTVYVDDTYGKGYNELLNEMATAQEMELIGSVPIPKNITDYATVAKELDTIAANADSANTAVVLVLTGQMATELIKEIPQDGKLASLKWFASSDVIGDKNILADQQVAAFANKTGMEGLSFGYKDIALDALPYIGSVLEGATEYSPYALTTWDALWLVANTYSKAPDADFDTLKQNLVSCAQNYRNAFGSYNIMNENGDTKSSRFMRYMLSKEDANYTWHCKGHYVNLGMGEPIIHSFEWEIAPDAGEVQVGALLPLSGNSSEQGKEIESILNYSAVKFNKFAQDCGSDLQIKLVVEDTGSDPAKAEEAAKKLINMGIKSIIGPAISSELETVRPLIDAAGVVAISPLSTSPSLGAKDSIYRLMMNDSVQSQALASLMKKDGIEKVVILNSSDIYGNEFAAEMKELFEGEVVAFPYDPQKSDYSGVLQQAEEAVQDGNAAKTAVLAVSHDEITDIMNQIGEDSGLRSVRWYGTDSSALSNALLENAAETAVGLKYTALDYTPYGKSFDPLYYVVNYQLQPQVPFRESSISVFDGLWLIGCAYLQEGTSADVEALNQYVSSNSFRGLGGVLKLDENGDRQFGYYKVYQTAKEKDAFSWTNIGVFSQDLINKGVLEMYE